jgi:hypothetical protein
MLVLGALMGCCAATTESSPLVWGLNYADGCCALAQAGSEATALRNGVDKFTSYTKDMLTPEMLAPMARVMTCDTCKRGAGYWSWKPLVIVDMLEKAQWGDVVSLTR